MTSLRGRATSFVGAVLASLILGHYAVLMAAHGPSSASSARPDGHEAPWVLWSVVAAAAVGALVVVALRHLRVIRRPGGLGGKSTERPSWSHVSAYAARVGRWWVRLLVGVTLLYLLQENLEYLRAGASLPGVDVLHLGEHGAALPLIALATFVVAAVIGLADWCRCVLARRRTGPRPSVRGGRPYGTRPLRPSDVVLASTILAGRSAGRSPPAGFATPG